MFLLFLNTSPAVPAPATFTFQYVSIISRTGYYCFSIARKNLHSNMFLLFRWSFYLILLSNAIYIPICFYYFGLRPCSGHSLSHLHSNMFLLFLNDIKSHHNYTQIYIPICFYYFEFLQSRNLES